MTGRETLVNSVASLIERLSLADGRLACRIPGSGVQAFAATPFPPLVHVH
jgi:hypothetical protein